MSKKFRDWLFILFIVTFVVSAFFVSIYAAGYSFRRTWPPRFDQLFEKTGMLILDSEPENAVIYLNNERQRSFWLNDIGRGDITTPTKIKNMIPGEYTLRLEKEGYWPLEKKVVIESGKATFAEDFILFRQTTPSNLAICAPQELSFSPEKKNFLILPAEGLVINLKTETSSQLTNKSILPIQWSQNGSKILFNGQLIALNNDNINFDIKSLTKSATNFYWDEANDKIYYQDDGAINCVATGNQTVSTVLKGGNYAAYAVRSGLIYTIEKETDRTYLRIYDADTFLRQSSSDLPSGDYHFQQNKYRLDLYDNRQKALYVLNDGTEQPLARQIKPVVSWQWLDSNYLFWHNGFEIYTLDIDNGQQTLLVRTGDELTGIAWNRSKNYLLYSSAKEIQIVNLNLEQKMPISLLKAEEINNLWLDEKNQIIYFYAKIDDKAGVYKLQLQ